MAGSAGPTAAKWHEDQHSSDCQCFGFEVVKRFKTDKYFSYYLNFVSDTYAPCKSKEE